MGTIIKRFGRRTRGLLVLAACCAVASWADAAGPQYLLITDQPSGPVAASLGALYPGLLAVEPVSQAINEKSLRPYSAVVMLITDGDRRGDLDVGGFRDYVRSGGRLILSLDDYAWWAKCGVKLVRQPHRVRPDALAESQQTVPSLVVVREGLPMTGFPPGSIVPWYGLERHGDAFRTLGPDDVYLQRQLVGLAEGPGRRVLARSTVGDAAVIVEERLGRGAIVAIDLRTMCEPWWRMESCHGWAERGGFNKYLFVGNCCGGSVRNGRYFNRKLTLLEYLAEVRRLCDRYPELRLQREGDDVFSITIGDDQQRPVYLYRGDTHQGIEWSGAYHALVFAEYLARERHVDPCLDRKLNECAVKIVPMSNFAAQYMARTKNGRVGVSDPYLAANGGRAALNADEQRAIESIGPVPRNRPPYDFRLAVGWHGTVVSLLGPKEGRGMNVNPCGVPPWGRQATLARAAIDVAGRRLRNRYVYWDERGAIALFGERSAGATDAVAAEGPMRYSGYFFPPRRPESMDSLRLWLTIENHDPVNPPVPGVRTSPGRPDLFGQTRDQFDCYFSHPPYFMAMATDVECEVASAILMPHRWHQAAGPEGSIVLRWSEDNPQGPVLVAWPRGDKIRGQWLERIEMIPRMRPLRLTRSPVSGLRHVEGARWGCRLGQAPRHARPGISEEREPTFTDWQSVDEPEAYRTCDGKFLCYFDRDGDGCLDTFLLDGDGDGRYERQARYDRVTGKWQLRHGRAEVRIAAPTSDGGATKGLIETMDLQSTPPHLDTKRPVAVERTTPLRRILIDRYHRLHPETGHWGDSSVTGFSALGARLSADGWDLDWLDGPIADASLANTEMLIIHGLGGRPLGPEELATLERFVDDGGRLLIVGSADPEPALGHYLPVTVAFGMALSLEIVGNYEVRDRWQVQVENRGDKKLRNALPDGRLLSGLENLRIRSRVVLGTSGTRPILTLGGKTIAAATRRGKGIVYVLGTSDVISNATLSERLSYPQELHAEVYPRSTDNRQLRDRLIRRMLSKDAAGPAAATVDSRATVAMLQALPVRTSGLADPPPRCLRYLAPSPAYLRAVIWSTKPRCAPGEPAILEVAIASRGAESVGVVIQVFHDGKQVDTLRDEQKLDVGVQRRQYSWRPASTATGRHEFRLEMNDSQGRPVPLRHRDDLGISPKEAMVEFDLSLAMEFAEFAAEWRRLEDRRSRLPAGDVRAWCDWMAAAWDVGNRERRQAQGTE